MSVGDGVEKERGPVPQRAPPTPPTGTVVSVAQIIEWSLGCLYRRFLAQSASFRTIPWLDEARVINSLHFHNDRCLHGKCQNMDRGLPTPRTLCPTRRQVNTAHGEPFEGHLVIIGVCRRKALGGTEQR
jgi:hypothetical protein